MTVTPTMQLSDLCDFVAVTVDPSTLAHANDMYVGLEHVPSSRFVRIGQGKASDVQSAKYVFQSGDVLYGKLRPYLDKAIIADDKGICTTELLVLRPKKCVDPRFIAGLLHTPKFIQYAISGTTGAQHPRTSWQHIRKFVFPAFSTKEQITIAHLLWNIHNAITENQTAFDLGFVLKRVAAQALFTHGLKGEAQKETEIGPMPESWEILAVSESVRLFRFDRSKQIAKSSYKTNGQWPIIDQGQKTISGYTDDIRKVIFPDNPIIVFGDHTRVFKYVDYEFALGADGTKLLLANNSFSPRYLFHALSNLEVPDRGYNRHYKVLSELRVQRPSINEQQAIASVLDAIDHKIDLHCRKQSALDNLFKALLHKLMIGEIRVGDLDLSALANTYIPQPKEANQRKS